jgi:hypothetical protein
VLPAFKATPAAMLTDRPPFVMTESELKWRWFRCVKLGASEELASEIAGSDVDVHSIEWLLSEGCPLDVAWRILS